MLFKLISKPTAAPEEIFLEGVKYHPNVQFVPFSEISLSWREHTYTREIFKKAAKLNTMEAWESLGIPPIEAFRYKNKYFHIVGSGQTRINSVCDVMKNVDDIRIPVWDVTSNVRILSESLLTDRPTISLLLRVGMLNDWNISGRPLTSFLVWDDEGTDFFGFG